MLMYSCFLNLFFGVDKVCPKLKRRYHACLEKVKEYLETVNYFDELISPQSLFFHFLGPEPSSKIRRDIETIKKSKYTNDIFFLSSLKRRRRESLFPSYSSGMTTKFSKAKLAEA